MRTPLCQLAAALFALTPATLLAQPNGSITPKETAARREAIAARIDASLKANRLDDVVAEAKKLSPKAKAAIALLVAHHWLAPLEKGAIVRGAARREAWRIVGAANVV